MNLRDFICRMRRDDGFAMVFVMGAVALITVISVSGYAIAQQSLAESVRNTDENRAYQAASAGLEQELSWFDPNDLSRYPITVSLGTGADTYTARIVDMQSGVYEMQCEGRSGASTETVLVRFQYLNLWDMNISGGSDSAVGSGAGLNGNSWIMGSLYIRGDIEWTAAGKLYGGPIFIKDGTWMTPLNGQIGAISQRVDIYGPDPSKSGWYYNLRGSAPDLQVPTLSEANMDDYRTKAEYTARAARYGTTTHPMEDPTHYTILGNNESDVVVIGDVNFGDKDRDAIAYENGVLYFNQVDTDGVDGADTDPVIYSPGTIVLNQNVMRYRGRGILVAKKGFKVEGAFRPLSGRTEWIGPTNDQRRVPLMDADECVGLLTMGDVVGDPKSSAAVFEQGGGMCAAVFANGAFSAPNTNYEFRGSMICSHVDYQKPNGLLATQPGLYKSLPKGMPELSGFTARGDWVRR